MNQVTTQTVLEQESATYRGRGGISAENRSYGFRPAFLDTESGAVYLSATRMASRLLPPPGRLARRTRARAKSCRQSNSGQGLCQLRIRARRPVPTREEGGEVSAGYRSVHEPHDADGRPAR
jgi:hypothetical protein